MGTRCTSTPDDPAALTTLHLNVHLGASGAAQLRLDAIDALETHYTPPGHGGRTLHQPLQFAHAAGARLLEVLGFTDVARDGETVTGATPEATAGYILNPVRRQLRPAGRARLRRHHRPTRPDPGIHQPRTARHQRELPAAERGTGDPTFYSKLYPDLRTAFTQAADTARAAQAGVWQSDVTTSGAQITAQDDLSTQLVIMPKLFRRLAGTEGRRLPARDVVGATSEGMRTLTKCGRLSRA